MSIQTQPKQLMLAGLRKASQAHKDSLAAAQWLAEMIGHQQETVTADDVFRWVDPSAVGAAAGNLFRGGSWVFSHWQDSERPSNHGRPLRAWRLK